MAKTARPKTAAEITKGLVHLRNLVEEIYRKEERNPSVCNLLDMLLETALPPVLEQFDSQRPAATEPAYTLMFKVEVLLEASAALAREDRPLVIAINCAAGVARAVHDSIAGLPSPSDAAAGVTDALSPAAAPCTGTTPEINSLRAMITNLDALSQEGFDEIKAIAQLALRSMETPEGAADLEGIAIALQTILGRADDVEDAINTDAGSVGCAWVDVGAERRRSARLAAKEVAHG